MRITLSHAIGGYAAVMTLAVIWLGTSAMAAPTPQPAASKFTTIDVQRINVREPDGTLRMVLSSRATLPGIIVGKKEYPHPNRSTAGMLFYNDEGIENGGLSFDGGMKDGKPTNSGGLTFDRYRQDQTLELVSDENGSDRKAGLAINDRPDGFMDIQGVLDAAKLPRDEALAAATKANVGIAQRAWLGRTRDGKVSLILSDPQGRPRLTLGVSNDGTPSVDMLDASGKVTRSLK